MPRILLSSARVRSAIADAITDADVIDALRRHGIRYTLTTAGGRLHVRVPVRSGAVQIFFGPDRSGPFRCPFHIPAYHSDD